MHVLPYIKLTDHVYYTPSGFEDSEDKDGYLLPGEWRLLKGNDSNNSGFVTLPHVRGSRSRQDTLETRHELKVFLNSDEGSLPWQTEYIRRTSYYAL